MYKYTITNRVIYDVERCLHYFTRNNRKGCKIEIAPYNTMFCNVTIYLHPNYLYCVVLNYIKDNLDNCICSNSAKNHLNSY